MGRLFPTADATRKITTGDPINTPSGQGTVALYFYNKNIGANDKVILGNRAGSTGYVMRIDTNELLDCFVYVGSIRRTFSTTALAADTWYQIIFCWDDVSGIVELYVNNMFTPEDTVATTGSYLTSSTNFGCGAYTSFTNAAGGQEHLCIWDKKLDVGERIQWKQGGVPSKDKLVLHWEMDKSTPMEHDLSGHGHHGFVSDVIPMQSPSQLAKAVHRLKIPFMTLLAAGAAAITKTFTIDAVIQANDNLKTFTLDAVIQKLDFLKTFTIDAVIQSLDNLKTFTIDSVIQSLDNLKTFTIDAIIQKLDQLKTFTIDSVIDPVAGSGTKTFTIDSVIQKLNFTKTFTIDAVVQKLDFTKTFTIDSIIQKLDQLKTFTIDSVIKKLGTLKTFTIDAVINDGTPSATITVITDLFVPNKTTDLFFSKKNNTFSQ